MIVAQVVLSFIIEVFILFFSGLDSSVPKCPTCVFGLEYRLVNHLTYLFQNKEYCDNDDISACWSELSDDNPHSLDSISDKCLFVIDNLRKGFLTNET